MTVSIVYFKPEQAGTYTDNFEINDHSQKIAKK